MSKRKQHHPEFKAKVGELVFATAFLARKLKPWTGK